MFENPDEVTGFDGTGQPLSSNNGPQAMEETLQTKGNPV
jgi:hypothetical protein